MLYCVLNPLSVSFLRLNGKSQIYNESRNSTPSTFSASLTSHRIELLCPREFLGKNSTIGTQLVASDGVVIHPVSQARIANETSQELLHPAIYTAVPFPQVLPQIPTFYVASNDVTIAQILSAIHLTTKRSTVMVGAFSRLKVKETV